MNITKLIAIVSLAMTVLTMVTPNQFSIFASPTTEDDGYTYPDDATEDEKEEIVEREQEAWEDAGRPGDNDNNDENDDDNDSNDDLPECQNGVTQECVISEIGLICSPGYDLSSPSIVGGGHACQDIYAGTYEPEPEPEPESELKTCKDGTLAMSCGMIGYATGSSNAATTGTITPLPTSTTESTAADASNCKLDGSADGIQQKFDTAKYQACMLHTKNDKIYYDGFVAGCMNVGNTKLICQTVADSSILNMKT